MGERVSEQVSPVQCASGHLTVDMVLIRDKKAQALYECPTCGRELKYTRTLFGNLKSTVVSEGRGGEQ